MKITSVMEFYYCNDITLNMEPHYIKHGIILQYESPETRINKGFFENFPSFLFFLWFLVGLPESPDASVPAHVVQQDPRASETGGYGGSMPP